MIGNREKLCVIGGMPGWSCPTQGCGRNISQKRVKMFEKVLSSLKLCDTMFLPHS